MHISNFFLIFVLQLNKEIMKIYLVNELHFFISNGTDYLSAVSPFNKGLGYKDIDTAVTLAKNLFNEYKELNGNGIEHGVGKNYTAQVQTPTMRIVWVIEEIEIK